MEITLGEATKLLHNIMANYSQWHNERSSTSKKVHAIEEINVLSGKMDELMKLFASKISPIDPNDMPLSTLIENNNESMDVNFVGRTILVITRMEVISTLGRFLVIPLIIMVIITKILMEIIIIFPLILITMLNNLLVLKRISMLWLKKNCLRLMIWLGTWIEFLLRLIL